MRASSIYSALLRAYPSPFRHEYGHEMLLAFTEQLHDARRRGARRVELALWIQAARDLLTIAPREHAAVIQQDLRVAFRTTRARPAFAIVAILSLSIGIGANTAIFGLWNSVRHAALPGVARPEQLVILTDPTTSGSWHGTWTTRIDGPRNWASYPEFEQLRDHASAFSALMASDASLATWQVRIDGVASEDVRGRLVSGGFFDVLGVRPAVGRLFTTADDRGQPMKAVISYGYWQRRFGGQAEAIGRTLAFNRTAVTIVGVAPKGFIGESNGQQPDVWLPLRLQPLVLPGDDRLHERAPDKVMWLHVFGRLKPTVSLAQAETQANAILRANLEAFYGGGEPARRDAQLDQRFRITRAARGASSTLDQFDASVTLLLAAVAILLLISCANLANLLMARGVARHAEIAIRIALGARRGRLVRQLVTESLALAAVGGVASVAIAFVLHRGLVRVLQAADPDFITDFSLNPRVVVFLVAVTLLAALAFSVMPAWQLTTGEAATSFDQSHRRTIGSRRELRSGRCLVAAQLALSLPLLVGAGLLVRTASNLQHPALGFRGDGLLLARVTLGELVGDPARRDRTLRDLTTRIEHIPGVVAVTYSQLGVLGNGRSLAPIEVEGHGIVNNRDVAFDRVAANYFAAIGIPLRLGRDLADADRADSPRVCVVNDAFVKTFLAGRYPLGMHVTLLDNDGARVPYEIVGVAADARIHELRGDVQPRFFVPAEQRRSSSNSRTFLIRTASPSIPTTAAVREAATVVDRSIALAESLSFESHLSQLTVEERAVALLATSFGGLALALAAIGLFGVLSYGVSRRSREIAVRMALGAPARAVVLMILRETFGLILVGAVAGGVLAIFSSRLIAARLYGVASHDPGTLAGATMVLLIVACGAAYLPARRASNASPATVLQQP